MKLLNKNKNGLYIIFILGICYFFYSSILSNLDSLIQFNFSIDITYIIYSVILSVSVILYWGFLWKFLIKNNSIRYRDIFYIHSISWLAKYLPGKAGIILSKIYFLTEHGVSKKQGLITSIYENIFQIVSAFLISIPILLYYFAGVLSDYYLYFSVAFIAGFLIFIYPPIFYRLINLGLKLFKRELLTQEYFLSSSEILRNIFLYSIGIIANGIAFFLMIKGITNISWDLLVPIIGLWNFAGVIGLLAIFAPAGLGVREGILIVFLATYFPIEIATLISVFSRLWTTISDGLIGLYIIGYKWKLRKNNNKKNLE